MRKRVIAGFKAGGPIDISRCWNVIAFILAEGVSFSLFIDRKLRPLIVLENNTDIPFISGDQPAVNLMSGEDGKPPEFLILYYPVSPRFALLLDDPNNRSGLISPVTTDTALMLNRAIARAAVRQTFANSEAVLAAYNPASAA